MSIDRDAAVRWHNIVCAVVAGVATIAFWISKRIHLPFLRLGEIAVAAHTKHSRIVTAMLTEQIAELNREIAIKETRVAWEQRNQP